MTRFVVDTSTLIDISKGVEPVTSRFDAMVESGDDFYVCAVTVSELVAGLSEEKLAESASLILRFEYTDVSRDAAVAAGRDRYRFARHGLQIATADALIAAAARELGAILITDNLRHFPMSDIQTLSLRW